MLPLDAPTVQLSDASFKRLAGKGSVYFNAVKAKFPCSFSTILWNRRGDPENQGISVILIVSFYSLY